MTARPIPRPRQAPTPRTVPLAPRAYTSLPDWQRRQVDTWVAETVAELGWPVDLEAAGVDVHAPAHPNWHPDNCNHPVAVATRTDAGELTLPCTLPAGHGGAQHQVRAVDGQLLASTDATQRATPVTEPEDVKEKVS